jgi:hypothetical protein
LRVATLAALSGIGPETARSLCHEIAAPQPETRRCRRDDRRGGRLRSGIGAGGAAVRSAVLILALVFLPAGLLAACSGGSPVAPPGATESAAMVEKNCNDPHWREQNLGLWYSVCRRPLRW